MEKQMSSCILSSEWQIPSARNCDSENEPHPNTVRHQFSTTFSNVCQDSSVYDYIAAGDMPSGNVYLQNTDGFDTIAGDSYMNYDDSRDLFDNSSYSRQYFITLNNNAHQNFSHCNYDYSATGDTPSIPYFYLQNIDYPQSFAGDSYVIYDDSAGSPIRNVAFSGQSDVNNPYALPIETDAQYYEEPIQQCLLQYGIPTVTNYGTVALLLRHLIRVDLTANGSVSVNNFPAMSVTTLNVKGNKCYVKHPNGLVFQDKRIVHMMTGNSRLAKISRRGVTFSNSANSLAYNVDESGTKTTTAKFADLSRDLTMDVFYDSNVRNVADLEKQSHNMVSEAVYQKQSDGSELWELGKIRISQDKWGQVSVTQTDSGTTVTTSPTIRLMDVQSPSISVTISCYSKNYFNVNQDSCSVTSGFCGLIVRNQSQKAGLDRSGKLVLF